ncbi:MAG: MFS transporter [Acidobacteriota bacterium]|nr:MFS transporter [Acidobacteriota bacterium]
MRTRLPPALRDRDFARLWTSSLANGLASQMVAVAIGWQVYAIHRDPLDLGLVGLAEFVPLPLLALPAGQIADRVSRRTVSAVSVLLTLVTVAVLLAITIDGAHALWPFLAVGATAGVASAVGSPATRALTPEIVPAELLASAVALRSVASQIGIVAGPALGGVIFAVEPIAVYAAAVALLVVALGAIVVLPRRAAPLVGQPPPDWDSLVAGVRFILRTRTLLGAISLDLVAVLLGDSIALAPVFARTILHAGPIGLGALRTAPSLGALAAGLLLARRPLPTRAGPTLLVVVGTFGAAMIVFGLSKSLPLSLGALALSGFVDMISVNIRATTLALVTPIELQGRVNAVEWVFIGASNELGAFESGAVASLIGAVPAVVLGGGLMMTVAATWPRLFPALSRLGRLEELQPA